MDKRLICSEEKKASIRKALSETRQKRTGQVVKVYECKVRSKRLNSRQKEQLNRLFLEAKWFYNHVLNIKKTEEIPLGLINSKNIQTVKHFDKDHNEIESELTVLASQHKQQIIRNMVANLKTIASLIRRGYQKKGGLRFKSEFNAIPLRQYNNTYRFKSDHKVKIQGISGELFIYGTRQFWESGCEFANATLLKKPDGYYIKFTCYFDKNQLPMPKSNGKELGIDFGCKTTLTFSDGKKLQCQIEESDRLMKLSQRLNRHQTKRSNNRDKTINKIQREYQKINNKKQEFSNQLYHKMKSYDKVVIQDEQLSNWKKTGHGKKVQHSCMGTIKTKLKQLPNVVVLNRFIPTTKLCMKCGTIHREMKLKDRIFECCGDVLDRDIHAAQNMLDIYHLVDDYLNEHSLLPSERGEVTLAEFKTAIDERFNYSSTSPNVEARRCQVFSLA